MEDNRCDICGQPATHFFTAAHCDAAAGLKSSESAKLCALHAAAHAVTQAQETLRSMLSLWRTHVTAARPSDVVEVDFDCRTEAAATSAAGELGQACGGEASAAKNSDGWTVVWRLPMTTAALDQWQCEGWSRRIDEMLRRGDCTLNGFAVPA
jgi:hypothetical protein